ncbi:ATP-dependent nuclease [Anaerobium acetethylicum]|uniref:Predicted ATP-dependent endonuclease of the OLD family, contains P-loop ATPase and TOPRIM domains n=1 Tax=Anaerobium acetethylicum TaxID=1619234 RepID=A0A1D3TYA7_9FIRM|nr:AAA family ATPase [Anaerobium acetethylicum]SCP99397.1 Predicted ATP-dependent endonuclease of the OLD family, contains P-loop ATPase and TOPRIM domains [Anaerobium acetethylicum]
MKICSIGIKNFKSIENLYMNEIDSALILVGKNSTGKSSVIDAILAAAGDYKVREADFDNKSSSIEIQMELEITEEDLVLLYQKGIVSKYRNYNLWLTSFMERLPSYKDGRLTFTCIISRDKKIRYSDGFKKNNSHIREVFPKIHYIDNSRDTGDIERDIFILEGQDVLAPFRENLCIFDQSKICDQCFDCIGYISQKPVDEMSVFETAKLLEHKLTKLNMSSFADKVNRYYHKNSGDSQDIRYISRFDMQKVFRIDTMVFNKDRQTEGILDSLSAATKSIYLLSLLEAYIDETDSMPCIIMMEDPEIYLHPELQKVASEILYRLSKKNQVIFTTHSPNMIFNFTSRQIRQVILDDKFYTTVNPETDIDEILDDLGYTANDLMNISFVFIVEGKQDSSRLPLLLEKYYAEVYDESGRLKRISIITTNSCTNIKTYANLKYINQLYLKDQFLMIRDSDGRDPKFLVRQLCSYYAERGKEEEGKLPQVHPKNVLVLKYYSFENYFLDPATMEKIGVIRKEEDFYNILYDKFRAYLSRHPSVKRMTKITGIYIKNKEDLIKNIETIKIFVKGHNLFDIFYGRYKDAAETEILKKYIDAAPREVFADILDVIDSFVYFNSRKKKQD